MSIGAGAPVRPTTIADLAAVRAHLAGADLPVEDLASAPGLRLWVIEDHTGITGTIGLERHGAAGLVRSLAVAPAYRGRGQGRALVATLEREARSAGIELLVLLTQTAERFFRDRGYRVVERAHVPDDIQMSAEFRLLCPASAVCLMKSLDESTDRQPR